jgi:hypothetical protein
MGKDFSLHHIQGSTKSPIEWVLETIIQGLKQSETENWLRLKYVEIVSAVPLCLRDVVLN